MQNLIDAASGWAQTAIVITASLYVIGWWWHNDKRVSAALIAAGPAMIVIAAVSYWDFP